MAKAPPSDLHSRSILFPGIGATGQERIARFSFAMVGVGAVCLVHILQRE